MKTLKLLSFNIRIDAKVDGLNQWSYRKENVKTFLLNRYDDVIGIQEAGPHMYQFLKKELNSYEAFGIPRDSYGEATPIFLKNGNFEVLSSNTLWLTQTPHIESSIPGSNHPRVVTYVVIKDQVETYAIFNTHLDYTGDQTTLEQVKHLEKIVREVSDSFHAKTIILGDFNSHPESKTIKYLESSFDHPYQVNREDQLTFHGFSDQKMGKPIDYFFYDQEIKPKKFEIIYTQMSTYLSDHYPIAIEI